MQQNPGRLGILVTHSYLNNDDCRSDHGDKAREQAYTTHDSAVPGEKNDGEELWQKLVKRHDFVMTLNGHVVGDGTGYLEIRNVQGRTVHQILATTSSASWVVRGICSCWSSGRTGGRCR